MKAAIYTRISRDEEGRGLGVERQREDCERLIALRGWEQGEVFVDNDVSASTASRKMRPAYERMMAEVRAGRYQVVVAYSNSRLTRRPREWYDWIDLANKGVVQIHTVASGTFDLTTADGRASAMTVAIWDAAEAERTSERLTRQKAGRASAGLPQGGRYRSFGYTRQFEPVPEEVPIVRDIFERRASGESATSIAADLAAQGRVGASGKPWSASSVAKLISRPGYAGLRAYQGQIIGPTAYPPLIEEATWRAANGEAAKSSAGTNARRWLLSGLAICERCDGPMAGNASLAAYRCNRERGGCGNTKIKASWLEGPVVSLALARMERQVGREVHPPMPDTRESGDFTGIDARIGEVRAAYATGHLSFADMTALLAVLREQRRGVEEQVAATRPTPLAGPIVGIAEWVRADISRRRVLIADQLHVVVVGRRRDRGPGKFDPGRLTITWADGEREVVTSEALATVPYWNSQKGTWRFPEGVPVAQLSGAVVARQVDAGGERGP